MKNSLISKYILLFSLGTCLLQLTSTAQLRVTNRTRSPFPSPFHHAVYLDKTTGRLLSPTHQSHDNGKHWIKWQLTDSLLKGLPDGYRRNISGILSDEKNNRLLFLVNSMDVEGLDPTINEPPIALNTYYLRYLVSVDSGKSIIINKRLVLPDAPDSLHPFPGMIVGKNSFYLGDLGSQPILTTSGDILIPGQATLLGNEKKLANPGGGYTYTDIVLWIGKFQDDNQIKWSTVIRVPGNPLKSTRGWIEPSLLETEDKTLWMVIRGSNEVDSNRTHPFPGYKWLSKSFNNGRTWTDPIPLSWEDGSPLFSPSSMSTFFRHSSGRYFWIGNSTAAQPKGNLPRWPLLLAEFNPVNGTLSLKNKIILDTQEETDKTRGRLDISHFWIMEDAQTKEIIITYPRSYNSYKEREWIELRLNVESSK